MHPRPRAYKSILMRKLRDELINRYEDRLDDVKERVEELRKR